MALPSSGQLSFNDINIELGNSSGSTASLRDMSSATGFTTPDQVSEFYGVAASNILVSWGATGGTYLSSLTYYQYRAVSFTGRGYPLTFRPYFTQQVTSVSAASVVWYYQLNSTAGAWTQFGATRTSVSSATYQLPTNVDENDILYLRMRADKSFKFSSVSFRTILSSTYTKYDGIINSYATSGTTLWSLSF